MAKNKRGGFSGKSSFDFEIERYKNIATGNLITAEESENIENWEEVSKQYEYMIINLSISGDAYFSPGRTNCSNDDAYPDEGECNISSVIGPDNKDWENILTESERDDIINQITEGVQEEPDCDCEPDYDDQMYDRYPYY